VPLNPSGGEIEPWNGRRNLQTSEREAALYYYGDPVVGEWKKSEAKTEQMEAFGAHGKDASLLLGCSPSIMDKKTLTTPNEVAK